MASTHLSDAELLALEDRQMGYFLTDVRPFDDPAGVADLYPARQVMHTSCIALAALLPRLVDRILVRVGSPEAYAHRLRRVLSHATAQDIARVAQVATWGREMESLEGDAGPRALRDADCAAVLRFCYDVTRHYRVDGEPHPDDAAGLGSNYRILLQPEADALAQRCRPLATGQAGEVLALTAAMRSLSFLVEGQARAAVMMHGPYPTGARGIELIVVECADLHLEPDADDDPLPPLDVANLAIALQLRGCDISADRFGTLHPRPLTSKNVVAAALLTRQPDPFEDTGLVGIPLARAGALRRQCERRHAALRERVSRWEPSRRLAAGVDQSYALLCRLLRAAGASVEELEAAHRHARDASAAIVARHRERNLLRAPAELPFFAKLARYVDGEEPRLFTPFEADGVSR